MSVFHMLNCEPFSTVSVLSAVPWSDNVPCVVMLELFLATTCPFFTVALLNMNSELPEGRARCESVWPPRSTVPDEKPMRLPL